MVDTVDPCRRPTTTGEAMAKFRGTGIKFGEHDRPDEFYIDGVQVTEAEFRAACPEREGMPASSSTSAWPMRSVALAVHREQVDEANRRNAAAGVNAHYEADGTCVINSRADRRKLLKLEGFKDKDGGYGDG